MKKIFFIITALGLVYLIVSSIDTDLFSLRANETAAEQLAQISVEKQMEGADQSSLSAETIDASDSKIRALTDTIAQLRDSNQALESELSQLNQEYLGLQDEVKYLQSSLSSSMAPSSIDNAQEEASTSFLADVKGVTLEPADTQTDADINSSDESAQKRLMQQQAVLRDLAQKRQLAAIQALQTSSGR